MKSHTEIFERALRREPLTEDEALEIYLHAPGGGLALTADRLRTESVADPGVVTWQIDRNVNTTNVCISGCKFCNFYCKPHDTERAYITTIDEYRQKMAETLALGGDQLLLQGGLHPKLGIDYYEGLFRELKSLYPQIKLHALGAPEIAHIARISSLTAEDVLRRLMGAGLDSLPGAGAEILDDGIRRAISPAKPSATEWLDVMRTAHRLGLATSATMMYGHVETPRHRIRHLIKIRDLQAECPAGNPGFTAFIPWTFQSSGTQLEREGYARASSVGGALEETAVSVEAAWSEASEEVGFEESVAPSSADEYLRTIAISRIVLHNIPNIQASWLTVGKATAQRALRWGANDLGSIMIEENVVSSAGACNTLDREGMECAIREAGFIPRLRDQRYNLRDENSLDDEAPAGTE